MMNLRGLFDYQRFENNQRLGAMIAQTEAKYLRRELLEDDLEFLNAAGSKEYMMNLEDENTERPTE